MLRTKRHIEEEEVVDSIEGEELLETMASRWRMSTKISEGKTWFY